MSGLEASRKKYSQLNKFERSQNCVSSSEYLNTDISVSYPSDSEDEDIWLGQRGASSRHHGEPILNVEWQELKDVSHLNSGSMCSIYICTWRDNPDVVAKLVRTDCADPDVASSDLELELHVLRKLRHPNVVRLVGAGMHPRRGRFLLLERLHGGTLSDRIEFQRKEALILAPTNKDGMKTKLGISRRASENSPSSQRQLLKEDEVPQELPPPSLTRMIEVLQSSLSLARALRHLHTTAIDGYILMHRDLKPDNIAFSLHKDKNGNDVRTLKVIDFGLAKLMRRSQSDGPGRPLARYQMTGETGSPRYMAPECHLNLPYNEKVDVYSFGMCIWEMVELEVPFKDAKSLKSFRVDVVQGGSRPPLKVVNWPIQLGSLVASCWHADMDLRPSFSAIVRELRSLLQNAEQQNTVQQVAIAKTRATILAAARRSSWFLRRDSAPVESHSARESLAIQLFKGEECGPNTPKTAYCSPALSPAQKTIAHNSKSSSEGSISEASIGDIQCIEDYINGEDNDTDTRGRSRNRSIDTMAARKRQQRRKSSIARLQQALARIGARFTPPSSPLGGKGGNMSGGGIDLTLPTGPGLGPNSPLRRLFPGISPQHRNSGPSSPSALESLPEVGDDIEKGTNIVNTEDYKANKSPNHPVAFTFSEC